MNEQCTLSHAFLEPFDYINQTPGKDVRGILIDCFQVWLQVPPDKISVIKDIIRSLHNASLLIDDIEDNSKLRRGQPVAHSIYGVPLTINCANYVYFYALQQCHTLQHPTATTTFITELLQLHRGQGYDIHWREQVICPSEEEYKQMALDKTAGLFRLAVGLMQAFSTAHQSTNFTPLVNALGLYFQIRDDYINICSDSYMKSKSYCEDLTEGKFSFPIIYAIHAKKNDTRLLNILRQRTNDVEVKRHAVEYMRDVGALTYTRAVLRDLKNDLMNELQALGGHEQLEALIRRLDGELDSSENTNAEPTQVTTL